MAEKTTHLGMAGHFASMSEFLLRGYNVATPVVDIGDDIYVVDDGEGLLRRVQVKTADGAPVDAAHAGDSPAPPLHFNLSRAQLSKPKKTPLYFMLMAYARQRWRFVLLSREQLLKYRQSFEVAVRAGAGRLPVDEGSARSDTLAIRVHFQDDCFCFWNQRLPANVWLDADFPPLPWGPGARRRAGSRTRR